MAKTKAKAKLPKRVGGVKLSKEIRKAGGKLLEKANSPLGRELIAAGLGLAATAAAAEREKRKAAPATRATPPPDKPKGASDPHELGVVLGKMAQAALAGLFAGKKG